jgi:hypothetical protein
MLMQDIANVPESSSSAQIWKKLWRLRVVPKVRVYAELNRRHIMDHGICKLCAREEESLYHALLHCDHTKQFWTTAFGHFGFTIPQLHPTSWMQDLLMGSFFTEEQVPIAMKVHSLVYLDQ